MNSDYLAHYGIKGQKWGIRRFQNKDGSYTPAGKNRYNSKLTSEDKRELINDINNHRSNLVYKNYNISKLNTNEDVINARIEMLRYGEIKNSYKNDPDTKYDYRIKALSMIEGEDENDLRKQYPKDDEDIDGWDSIDSHGFDMFLRDNGVDVRTYNQRRVDVLNRYEAECKKATDNLLGEFGKEKISKYGNESTKTIAEIVEDSLLEIGYEITDVYPEFGDEDW